MSMLVVLAMEGRPPTAIGVGRTMALAPPLPGALEAAAAVVVAAAAAADEETAVPMAAAEGTEVAGCLGPPTVPAAAAALAEGRLTGAAACCPAAAAAYPLMSASSCGGRTGPCGLEGGAALWTPYSTHSTRWAGNSLKWSMQVMCWQYCG